MGLGQVVQFRTVVGLEKELVYRGSAVFQPYPLHIAKTQCRSKDCTKLFVVCDFVFYL